MLELINVSKSFGATKVLKNLTFTVERGHVVGLLGPNGAGKTTTMRLVTTILEPDRGLIRYEGRNICEQGLWMRSKVGYLPENNPLYDDLLVVEYLDTCARLKGLQAAGRAKAIRSTIERTGLKEVWRTRIEELSKGYRQRVGLAQALLGDPELLILDEPTEGLDPNQRVLMRELIQSIGKERTVILSTHVLSEVTATCDRVMILHRGTIVLDSSVTDVSAQALERQVVVVETESDIEREALLGIAGVRTVEKSEAPQGRSRWTLNAVSEHDVRPIIFDAFKEHGWRLWELRASQQSLEEVFRELTVD